MPDLLRVLNDEGIREFAEFLSATRAGAEPSVPLHLLSDGRTSDPFNARVEVAPRVFASRYDFGLYLVEVLSGCEARAISLDHRLWTWLALYYFDYLCPVSAETGQRAVLENAVYVLSPQFSFQRYYRHLVRSPWLAVKEHGNFAKVLLISSGRGTRSDVAEQLGAYQDLFANRSLIEAAYRMYFDEASNKLRRGSGGKGSGSPRRLATVARQLTLTYDLADCSASQLMSLLPPEFRRWTQASEYATADSVSS